MKRIAAILVATGVLAAPAPAFACFMRGGPHEGSCGLGREVAHAAIQSPMAPGASEAARESPIEAGCTG